MSSLTTYYSSKLINKTNILFVLSPPLFKKIFFVSLFLSSLSFLLFLPITISPYQNFFFLSSSSLFSSPLLWSFSLFFFFFSFFFPLFSYPLFNAFFFFPFSLLTGSLSLSPMDHGGGGSWIMTKIWSGFG